MKNNKSIFKSIFFGLCALCFMGSGIALWKQPAYENSTTFADAQTPQIENEKYPDYFSAEEYTLTSGSSSKKENSLISSNTFLYYMEGSTSNYLKLSLKQNGSSVNSSNPAYAQVYYPDEENLSFFYFYTVNNISLSINGQKQEINMGDYVTGGDKEGFENKPEVQLNGFEMFFVDSKNPSLQNNGQAVPESRQIEIVDNNGFVKEGIYQLSLTIGLFSCTDGGTDGMEESFPPEEIVNINYNFYVLGRNNFFANSNPNIQFDNFDKTVPISEATSSTLAYKLYSNYSSETSSYNIPYIEYDYTRFEASITKELEENLTASTLTLDLDKYTQSLTDEEINPISISGDEIIKIKHDTNTKKARLFFYDVGNYTLSLNAIKLVDFVTNEQTGATEIQKYSLTGVSSETKKINVYMFGYQLNYTNVDKPVDENSIRPLSELKRINTNTQKFTNGADITSGFLNSNPNFSQANGGSDFKISNILDYINDNDDIAPVKTDQNPVIFTQNASPNKGNPQSYIYSTTQVNGGYELYAGGTLGDDEKPLYRTKFTGLTDNAIGTYIYVLVYTFNNYYTSENTLSATTLFHQVFYFEIESEIPTIEILTRKVSVDGQVTPNIVVTNDMFTNQDVFVKDTTDDDQNAYKKDVTIRIYAQNFGKKTFVGAYGYSSGISFAELELNENKQATLSQNAHYTIRLYYTCNLTKTNTDFSAKEGYFREIYFTIDKSEIQDLRARNFVDITNSTNYQYYSDLTEFATNQSIAISWKEKDSGASTYAYYRYFPIEDTSYYSASQTRRSATIERMLKYYGSNKHYMPVNKVLDMSTNNSWQEYKGNTYGKEEISSDYVLPDSDEGLYLFDVYDEAGNHSMEVFMIDKSTPIFAIQDENGYDLVSSSVFITKPCTLYWGNYKTMYIANFSTLAYYSSYTPQNITTANLDSYAFYKTHDGKTCPEIFKMIYNKLYAKDYLEYIENNSIQLTSTDGLSDTYFNNNTYTSYYMTIPINDKTYYIDKDHPSYISKQGSDNWFQDLTTNEEMTYRVLVRDMSNTKYDRTIADKTHLLQYTGYYSAYQTIIVSFDDSEFFIEYQNGGEKAVFSSNNVSIGTFTDDNGKVHNTKTTYLSPTKMQKAFSLSFLPTTSENGKNIQVDTVTIDYYPYVESHVSLDGTKYSYMELSQTATRMDVYIFDENGSMTSKKVDEIRLDAKNHTAPGKYVITRTYKIDGTYSYNENDFYQRTYIFIVDRNDVITSAELTKENPHLESLVGGDVFVSMYDTKTDASLVVTYPNSWEGSDKDKTLYNNGSTIPPRAVITTNKMPVKLYIPKYKYTTYTKMTIDGETGFYDFMANYNFNEIVTGVQGEAQEMSDYMNFFDMNLAKVDELRIAEYVLSANIYKDRYDPRNLYATASPMVDRNDANGNAYIAYDDTKSTNGFLKLYDTKGQAFTNFTEAGIYYVELFQGRYGIEVAENAYNQSIVFAFEIQRIDPDFTAQSTNGASLNSEIVSGKETYHTNQANLNLIWSAGNEYIAEIDIPKIKFVTSTGRTLYTKTWIDENEDGIQTDDELKWTDIFVDNLTPNTDSLKKQYLCQISLEKLGIYANGGWVDITMQYQNHNDDYYNKITKRIYVDLEAPSGNIQNLVALSTTDTNIAPLKASALRTYYTAKMEQTQILTQTSYNISNSTGTFAYYSYTVDENFLNTLKSSLSSSQSYRIFAKEFKDGIGNTTKYVSGEEQETAPADFLASNYTMFAGVDGEIDTNFRFNKNTYYEIVELDRAGNMAIYTIYIANYDSVVGDETGINNLVSYTTPNPDGGATPVNKNYTIDDFKATTSYPSSVHNIYSPTGFTLTNLNYFGDAWAQITFEKLDVNGYQTTYNLMLTPWDEGYAYAYVGNQYTKIALADLFDGSTSSRFKSVLKFKNRQNGGGDNFYFNIRNTTLSASLTNNQNEEFIRFAMPNDASIQNTIYGATYLTSIKITTKAGLVLYEETNKTGFASRWASNQNIQVLYDTNAGTITFKLSPTIELSTDTKLYYEYVDNYGNPDKQIHIYRETIIEKVVDASTLYAYYNNINGKLYYITENGLKYSYNPAKYIIKIFDVVSGEIGVAQVLTEDDPTETKSTKAFMTVNENNGYNTITVTHCELEEDGATLKKNYNNTFAIQVYDVDDDTKLIQTIYFTLYSDLPVAITQANESQVDKTKFGSFKINDANNNNITEAIIGENANDEDGYFSQIRISYNLKKENVFIPIKYSISTDKITWRDLINGETLECENDSIQKYYLKVWYDEKYLKNEVGSSQYVFGTVPESQIYEFNLSALTQTYWVEQTINGKTYLVEKSNKIYKAGNKQYSNHYIVNVDYADRNADPIKTNKELKITASYNEYYSDGAGVYSELWTVSNSANIGGTNIPEFSTNVVISYIPIKDNFVEEFFASNEDGILNESENLVNTTTKTIVISESSTVDQMELRWTKFYGIPQNEINIKIVKDGIELSPNVYSKTEGNKQYNYIKLNHSGKYKISLYDSSTPGNIQTFNKGNAGQSETFTLVFLKDVPFTMTYTNVVTGQSETSLPINEAVYNGTVSLNIDKNTRSEFYTYDGYPVISVKRNGVLYENFFQDDTTYIFNETGYYEVTFSATSNLPNVGKIRQQTWRFTILNENEHRNTYIFNRYSNYYIEKIEKNGIDVTRNLVETLDVGTYTVNNVPYLAELPLSYIDEKTGSGTYIITVNSNDKLLKSSSAISRFTFKVKINVGEAPIRVSLKEGESTTGSITVAYNLTNVYREMGECSLRILKRDDNGTTVFYQKSITSETTGEQSTTIAETGTFYIQIVSPSESLLYSYKVVRNEPLNTAAIVAIAISAVLLIAVIFIIIKLRKRISVK